MPNINTDFVTKTTAPGDYRDSRLLGFLLRISKTGTKSYQVQGRIKGAGIIRHTIGKHGAPWTAKFARTEAERVLRLMKTGIDPRIEKRERLEQQQAIISQNRVDQLRKTLTPRKVFEDWYKDERKDKESTKDLYKQVLHKHLPDWLDLPLCEITTDMVSKRYNQVADQTIASANNTFRALRRLYNWAILEHETTDGEPIISANPVEVLSKRNKWRILNSREDLIADEDIKAWFDAVVALDNVVFRDYFLLLLLTGLRKHEAACLRWTDINFKSKKLTARNTKNGRDHTLPMTDYIHSLLKIRQEEQKRSQKPSDYVFDGGSKHGHIVDVRHYQQKVTKASKVEFTPHALRRTFSYAAARVRLGDSERKALLNHLGKTDVTDAHYTPWQIEDLREPIKMVENYILDWAKDRSNDDSFNTTNVVRLSAR